MRRTSSLLALDVGAGTQDLLIWEPGQALENAVKMGAVEKLVLADALLRESQEEQRLHLEELMREVEQRRGSVTVVSTEHEAGAKLTALSGIAALLRFPVYRGLST